MTLLIDSLFLNSTVHPRSDAGAVFAPVYRKDRPSRDELLAIFAARKAR